MKAGNKVGAADMTKAIKKEKKDIRSDAKDLKADGVKHSIHRAEKHIRKHH